MFLDTILGINIFDPNTYRAKKSQPKQETTTKIETSRPPTYTVDQFRPPINIAPGDSIVYSSVTFTGKTENNTPSITLTNPNNTNTNQNNNNGNAVTPVTNIVNDLLNNSGGTSIDWTPYLYIGLGMLILILLLKKR